MDTEIVVAIIGAGAVIISALIAGVFSLAKQKSRKNTVNKEIKQNQTGTNNIQIGIQNNFKEKNDE